MTDETENNLELRRKVHNLVNDIFSEVEHGECFNDREMLNELLNKLDDMKVLACRYYESNREELNEEDE